MMMKMRRCHLRKLLKNIYRQEEEGSVNLKLQSLQKRLGNGNEMCQMMNLKMSTIKSQKELKTMIKNKRISGKSIKRKKLNKASLESTAAPNNQNLTSTRHSLRITI
jgi:hypothetical protein